MNTRRALGQALDPKTITREKAVSLLRQKLLTLLGQDQSVCQLAAEKRILCGGFRQYSDSQLREAYATLVEKNPEIGRPDLEKAANEWQLKRQRKEGALFSCDLQYRFYETCKGWDDFSNEDLSRFCFEILGEQFTVIGTSFPAVI